MTSTQVKPRYRIAVDAMGGDYAPGEMVAGAVQAARAIRVPHASSSLWKIA